MSGVRYGMYASGHLFIEANTMNPDQTATKGVVCSGSILFAIQAFKVYKQIS